MIHCRSNNVEQTRAIASSVARLCRPRDVIALAGEMGAGKTAFVSAFAEAMGVGEDEDVSSPTFTLVHSYTGGRIPIHHADLYRLASLGEVTDLGLRELADMGAVVLVEWGDIALGVLGDCLVVTIVHDDEVPDARDIVVSVEGHGWDSRWETLKTALNKWVQS